MTDRFCKKAFTLAEVLITLGIIGIVAAMTLPALTASHRKSEVTTKLKRVYSVVNQAINMSVAEYGEAKYWWKDCGSSGSPTCTQDEVLEWFNTYIGKHLQVLKTEKGSIIEGTRDGFFVYLKDGSILFVPTFIYDITFYTNQKALDNPQVGINRFAFRFNPALSTGQLEVDNKYTQKETFEPYATSWYGTRENLLSHSTFGCKKDGGVFCAKLIQYDGWQIKDDYPYKF